MPSNIYRIRETVKNGKLYSKKNSTTEKRNTMKWLRLKRYNSCSHCPQVSFWKSKVLGWLTIGQQCGQEGVVLIFFGCKRWTQKCMVMCLIPSTPPKKIPASGIAYPGLQKSMQRFSSIKSGWHWLIFTVADFQGFCETAVESLSLRVLLA